MMSYSNPFHLIAFILWSIILFSCVSTSVTRLDTEYTYPPTSPNGVQLYLEPEDVPCNFERIALINTETDFELDNSRSIKAAKKEAATMGGNGIILKEYKYPKDEDGSSKIGTMVAIFISEEGCK